MERLRKRYGPAFQKKIDFYNKVAAPAVVAAERLQMDPRILMAQAAYESGWAGSELAKQANNLGGVKAKSGQPYIEMQSPEGYDKTLRVEPGKFVKYPSINAFFEEWPKTFAQPRYSKAIKETDPTQYAKSIVKAGYSTGNPEVYAKNMASIYKDIDKLMTDKSINESMVSGQGGTR